MKKFIKCISIMLAITIVFQENGSFAMNSGSGDTSSVSINDTRIDISVCDESVNESSPLVKRDKKASSLRKSDDDFDWEAATKSLKEKRAEICQSHDAFVSQDAANAQREKIATERADDAIVAISERGQKEREEFNEYIHRVEQENANLGVEVDNLRRKIKEYERDDCGCFKNILCRETNLAHTFNKKFWQGFACGGAISLILFTGMVVKSFF